MLLLVVSADFAQNFSHFDPVVFVRFNANLTGRHHLIFIIKGLCASEKLDLNETEETYNSSYVCLFNLLVFWIQLKVIGLSK